MKSLIKRALQLMRLKITRIPRKRKNWDLKIGKYVVEMNPKGNLYDQYIINDNYSGELATLASIINEKYSDFTMVDIGANVGDTAAVVKNALEDLKIICVEGDDESFDYLTRNTQQFKNISNYKYYLGDKTENLPVKVDKVGWNNTIQITEHSSNTLNIFTFDDFLIKENINSENIKFIKIDTEGFDNRIIRGSKSHLVKKTPVLYFEYNTENHKLNDENGIDIFSFLEEIDYDKVVILDSNGKYLLSTDIKNKDILLDMHNYSLKYEGLYYDICCFYKNDQDLFEKFIKLKKYS